MKNRKNENRSKVVVDYMPPLPSTPQPTWSPSGTAACRPVPYRQTLQGCGRGRWGLVGVWLPPFEAPHSRVHPGKSPGVAAAVQRRSGPGPHSISCVLEGDAVIVLAFTFKTSQDVQNSIPLPHQPVSCHFLTPTKLPPLMYFLSLSLHLILHSVLQYDTLKGIRQDVKCSMQKWQ